MLKKISNERNYIWLVIIFIAIAIMSIFYLNNLDNIRINSKEVAKDYNEIIYAGKEKNNTYVSVDITELPILLLEEKFNYTINKYYLLIDKNNYMYIAKLKDSTFKTIKEIYDKNKNDFSYELKGYIYRISKDVKKEIVKMYNEEQIEKIDMNNYSEYFGNTYLDDTYTKYTTRAAVGYIIIIVSIIISIIFFIKWMFFIIVTNKTLKEISKDELEEELKKCDIIKYKKAKIYLTNKYLISMHKGLRVFRYNDIKWIFRGTITHLFYFGHEMSLSIYLPNKKRYETKGIGAEYYRLLDDIIQDVVEKNNNVLVGYTYENMENYNKNNS